MASTTLKKLTDELTAVKKEVRLLRSALQASLSTEHDVEGAYRPEFIKRLLRRARTAQPSHAFTGFVRAALARGGKKK